MTVVNIVGGMRVVVVLLGHWEAIVGDEISRRGC